jgi:hypothetical protein
VLCNRHASGDCTSIRVWCSHVWLAPVRGNQVRTQHRLLAARGAHCGKKRKSPLSGSVCLLPRCRWQTHVPAQCSETASAANAEGRARARGIAAHQAATRLKVLAVARRRCLSRVCPHPLERERRTSPRPRGALARGQRRRQGRPQGPSRGRGRGASRRCAGGASRRPTLRCPAPWRPARPSHAWCPRGLPGQRAPCSAPARVAQLQRGARARAGPSEASWGRG